MSARPSDADLALCLEFLDGGLVGAERDAFVLRLAREPELAAALDELALVDDALIRDARRARALFPSTPRRVWRAPALAAAAALLVALIAVALWTRARRDDAPRATLVASDESPLDWLARHGEIAALRPPGLDELRAGGATPNVGAADFVARARAAAERDERSTDVRAGYFRVAVEIAEPSSVLVLAVPEVGAPTRLRPAPGADASAAELAAGKHVLPGDAFALDVGPDGDVVRYERGYLVPVGARALHVVVARRAGALDAAELADLDVRSARGESALVDALGARGFVVETLVVREPR